MTDNTEHNDNDTKRPEAQYTDVRKTVSESEDKVVLKHKSKRGTGTRDEDKFDCKVKGDDPDEVADKMLRLLERIEGTDEDDGQGLMEKARDIQAGDADND